MAEELNESVTHIAGVVFAGRMSSGQQRIIQRCAVCGSKLIDITVEADAVLSCSSWRPGGFVHIVGGKQTEGKLTDTGQTPDDFCLSLVEGDM